MGHRARLRRTATVGACGLLAVIAVQLPTSAQAAAGGHVSPAAGNQQSSGAYFTGITTDAARYAPGALVTVDVGLTNTTGSNLDNVRLTLTPSYLGTPLSQLSTTSFSLAAGASSVRSITWSSPATDHRGYLLKVQLTGSSGKTLDRGLTAIDISSDTSTFPRYGFVSRYDSAVDVAAVTRSLNGYHIDNVQFYDWEHASHLPLAGTPSAPATSWDDIAGRVNQRQTVLSLLNAGHAIGAAAYNYNTLYNAWADYAQDGSGVDPQWGLYRHTDCTDQLSVPLPSSWSTDALYLFNPADPRWQSYIIGRESDVFAAYPFDGWQIDQLGDQGTSYTCSGASSNPADSFDGFLQAAAAGLGKKLVFNAVGQYGQPQIAADKGLSFLYTEAWPFAGQATYDDLATLLAQNSSWSGGTKRTVVAAYMDQNKCNAPGGTFNDAGVLLTDATIFSHGGAHIELGDVNHMLCAPYFPNANLSMSNSLTDAMHHYYDFLVAYENLLRDGQQPTNNTIDMPGTATSPDARAGTVWTFARSASGTDVLHFINLLGSTTDSWEDADGTTPTPPTLTNVTVNYCYAYGTPRTVNFASPDINGGASIQLHFKAGSQGNGSCMQFTIPELHTWDMVWVTR